VQGGQPHLDLGEIPVRIVNMADGFVQPGESLFDQFKHLVSVAAAHQFVEFVDHGVHSTRVVVHLAVCHEPARVEDALDHTPVRRDVRWGRVPSRSAHEQTAAEELVCFGLLQEKPGQRARVLRQ
jgi:hypothetical protein